MLLLYKKNKTAIVTALLSLAIFMFLFRTVSPIFKYIFSLFYIALIIKLIITKGKIPKNLFINISSFILPLSLFTYYLISFLISSKLYIEILIDIINIIFIFSFFLFYLIDCKDDISKHKFHLRFLLIVIFIFSLILSISEILRVYLDIRNIHYLDKPFLFNEKRDYNFASLIILFSIILTITGRSIYIRSSLFSSIYYILTIIALLLLGSRRAIFILSIIAALLVPLLMFKSSIKINRKQAYLYILITILLISSLTTYLFLIPSNIRINTLKRISIGNSVSAKTHLTQRILRFVQTFDDGCSFHILYDKLWATAFDPKNPECGWGNQSNKTVYPLSGLNYEFIPEGTVGYLMDRDTYSKTWDNLAISYTLIKSLELEKGDSIYFSAFCYVSKSFNGKYARIKTEGIQDRSCYYNLEQINSWQKLVIQDVAIKKGIIEFYFHWLKENCTDFNNLEGHLIYAYPSVVIKRGNSILFSTESINKTNNKIKFIRKNYFENTNNVLKTNAYQLHAGFDFQITKYNKNLKINDLVSNDTTYYPYRSNIKIKQGSRTFLNSRSDRWEFAFQIFSKEYNIIEKLFGGGFDYLNWYGYYFYKDKTKVDWPHNPFLSVLLYSGLLGLFIYTYFLYKVFYYYIKYRKEYGTFFIFFLITFFFSFFSSNSPFYSSRNGILCNFAFLYSLHTYTR
jgi:hypothetical protein